MSCSSAMDTRPVGRKGILCHLARSKVVQMWRVASIETMMEGVIVNYVPDVLKRSNSSAAATGAVIGCEEQGIGSAHNKYRTV